MAALLLLLPLLITVLDDSTVPLPAWPQTPLSVSTLNDSLFLSNCNYVVNFQPKISLCTSALPRWAITIQLSCSAGQQRKLLCRKRRAESAAGRKGQQRQGRATAEELHSCLVAWLYFQWLLFLAMTLLSACVWRKAAGLGSGEMHPPMSLCSSSVYCHIIYEEFLCQLSQCECDSNLRLISMGFWFIPLRQNCEQWSHLLPISSLACAVLGSEGSGQNTSSTQQYQYDFRSRDITAMYWNMMANATNLSVALASRCRSFKKALQAGSE